MKRNALYDKVYRDGRIDRLYGTIGAPVLECAGSTALFTGPA
jgi:hypothetical protein